MKINSKGLLAYFLGFQLLCHGAICHVMAATELAKINGTVITFEEFDKRYKENLKFFQFKTPTRKMVLDDLIKRELGIQAAKKMGLDRDPEVIEKMNTVLYHALLDKQLSKEVEKIQISDQDAKEYYEKNPEIRTSHIFVAVKPDATAPERQAALERIKKIQAEHLKKGKMTFSEIAQRYSEGIAAPMGGDIDYQTKDKLDPDYYAESLKLKTPGKVSGIVRSQFGYHIIKLTAIRPWEEANRVQTKRLLFEERRNQVFEKYMNELRKQSKVTIREDLLKD